MQAHRPNPAVATGPARPTTGRECSALDEKSFRRMIAFERKRTERSRQPFLLMLLDAGTCLPSDATGKITPAGPPSTGGVKALTAITDVVLITVGGPGMVGVPDVLGRTFRTTATVRADVLLISQSSSQNDLCLVIPSSLAKCTVEALRHEFAHELTHEKTDHITVDSTVAIVAIVGKSMRGMAGFVGRTFRALVRENVNIVAIAQGSTECTLSLVVAKRDTKAALTSIHREFQLGNALNGIAAEDVAPYPSALPQLAEQS